MDTTSIKAIIFDVDGTLTHEVSWMHITLGLGADPEKHKQIFDSMVAGELSYPEAKRQLLSMWTETGNANQRSMKQMFESWDFREDALEIIQYLKTKYHICLISGAVNLYIETIANKLEIKDWYANTSLLWDKDSILVDMDYHIDQAKKKLEQFNVFISQYGLNKNECIAVGDSGNDVLLFQEIKGIAINKDPHPELEALAYKRIKNLSELKDLL
jgi:HAD superfamily phosphoserine phosphatase-like hydrolase